MILLGSVNESSSGQLTFALLEETLLSAKRYKTRRISSEDYETSRSLFRYIGRVNTPFLLPVNVPMKQLVNPEQREENLALRRKVEIINFPLTTGNNYGLDNSLYYRKIGFQTRSSQASGIVRR